MNVSQDFAQTYDILCPKLHIGKGVFDLVNREMHCLKDPRLLKVISHNQEHEPTYSIAINGAKGEISLR